MEDIKNTVAKQIAALRIGSGMTQLELAEKLHYSDKAVSKWERGESIPELATLVAIAELFEVSLDELVRGGTSNTPPSVPAQKRKTFNRAIVTTMSILLVWFVAALVFVVLDLLPIEVEIHWLAFVYAVPVTLLLWLVFNSVWFNPRTNFLIISGLVWTTLGAFHISFLLFERNIWKIYLLGIPAQLVIVLWSRIKPIVKNKIQK